MYVYIIGTLGNKQKIGFSNNVNKRLLELQTGNPEKLIIHHTEAVPKDRVRLLERKIHRELGYRRIKGEWFDLTAEEAKSFLIFALIRWGDDVTLKYNL
jgi:hypothetical protein